MAELVRMGYREATNPWDHDVEAARVRQARDRIETHSPDLAAYYARLSKQMRGELRAQLPGVPDEHIERVGLLLLSKLAPLAIGLGVDPTALGAAGTVAALAVIAPVTPPDRTETP